MTNPVLFWLLARALFDDGFRLQPIHGALVAHDAYFYWTHRLLHRPAVLRRMHRTPFACADALDRLRFRSR